MLHYSRARKISSEEITAWYTDGGGDNLHACWTRYEKKLSGGSSAWTLVEQDDDLSSTNLFSSNSMFEDIFEDIEGWGGGYYDNKTDDYKGLTQDCFNRHDGIAHADGVYQSTLLDTQKEYGMPFLLAWFVKEPSKSSDVFTSITIDSIELNICNWASEVAEFGLYGINGLTRDIINEIGVKNNLLDVFSSNKIDLVPISYNLTGQYVVGAGPKDDCSTQLVNGDMVQTFAADSNSMINRDFCAILLCIKNPLYVFNLTDGDLGPLSWLHMGKDKKKYWYPTFMIRKFTVKADPSAYYGFVTVEPAQLPVATMKERKILHYIIAQDTHKKLNNTNITTKDKDGYYIAKTKVYKTGATSPGGAATLGIIELFKRLKLAGMKSISLTNIRDNATRTELRSMELGDTILIDYTQFLGEEQKEVLSIEGFTVEINAEQDVVTYNIEGRDLGAPIIGSDGV